MEVGDPEGHVVFLEEAVTKDARDQESTPGIVPDGESVFCDRQVCFGGWETCIHSKHVNVC